MELCIGVGNTIFRGIERLNNEELRNLVMKELRNFIMKEKEDIYVGMKNRNRKVKYGGEVTEELNNQEK